MVGHFVVCSEPHVCADECSSSVHSRNGVRSNATGLLRDLGSSHGLQRLGRCIHLYGLCAT